MIDGRRHPWFAVDSGFPFGRLANRLLSEFGPAGVVVWIYLEAAAKRAEVQGFFSYTSDAEGWEKLGIDQGQVGFTLDEFLALTGRLHETKKRRRVGVTTIELRRWDELQLTIKRRFDAERRARSRARNTRDIRRTDQDQDQDQDIDHRPIGVTAGLEVAIEEASKDPEVKNPSGAGRYRYQADPTKYDRIAELRHKHRDCSRCHGTGQTEIWSQGSGMVKVECPGEEVAV